MHVLFHITTHSGSLRDINDLDVEIREAISQTLLEVLDKQNKVAQIC